jgi:DNA-binding LytR/AlgR family response regulator
MTNARALSKIRGHEIGLGFLYWLSFLIALEPGNVARAIAAGAPLAWDHEVLRIFGAAMLGALATPAVAFLMRRFPIEGGFVRRHLAVHGASAAAIALGLVAASCALAPLVNVGDTRPFLTALPDHLAANWLLLAFSVAGLTALLQAIRSFYSSDRAPLPDLGEAPVAEAKSYLGQVRVKARGHVSVVDLGTVDWIEAQGNYVALHCGATAHLLRETLSTFEGKIDPAAFVRVHRSRLVGVAKIAAISPLANGDGSIRLCDGTDVRMSRGYREQVHARLAARFAPEELARHRPARRDGSSGNTFRLSNSTSSGSMNS